MAAWYLSQEFAADSPGSQVFLAPGPDDRRLLEAPSPWVMGRLVQFPGRYWHCILLAIAEVDITVADMLDRWSGSADPEDLGETRPTADQLTSVRQIANTMTARLRDGDAVTDQQLHGLGEYTREDMANMIDAFLLVVEEAWNCGLPFSAWIE